MASATLASLMALGSVLAGSASATLSDCDVQLGATPGRSGVVGTYANCENSTTGITNATSGGTAFEATPTGRASLGIGAMSDSGTGVFGITGGALFAGVDGVNSGTGPGVSATSTSGDALLATASKNGVHGQELECV